MQNMNQFNRDQTRYLNDGVVTQWAFQNQVLLTLFHSHWSSTLPAPAYLLVPCMSASQVNFSSPKLPTEHTEKPQKPGPVKRPSTLKWQEW